MFSGYNQRRLEKIQTMLEEKLVRIPGSLVQQEMESLMYSHESYASHINTNQKYSSKVDYVSEN